MGLFEGKSPAERNKIIALIVLGVLATFSLMYTFGPSFLPSKKTVSSTTSSPTPEPTSTEATESLPEIKRIPAQTAIDNEYASIPINYAGSSAFSVPVTGRNIFAFWEPGDPTPVPIKTPTPFVVVQIPTPKPIEYKVFLSFVTPQSVYAGSKRFRLEVNGDMFRPDSRIIFNGTPLATTFISEQRLVTDIPEGLISRAFVGSIMVDTPGTDFFSRQIAFSVQDPPKPNFEYIGMIARRHYNNDTAYFQNKGSTSGDPFSARLNDIIQNRFRVISISAKEVEFVDTQLGFRHKLPLLRPQPGTGGSDSSGFDGDDGDDGGFDQPPEGDIPGIPSGLRRAPSRQQTNNPTIPDDQDDQKVPDEDPPS